MRHSEVYDRAKRFVDAQLQQIKKRGAAPKLSQQKYKNLIAAIARATPRKPV